ncbi:hypothetical protein ACRAWF_39890 [Streptomyces sp. L7]
MALPADPDGVSTPLVVLYVVFLGFAAVHGALVGLRTRLAWPAPTPLAILLGLVLLAVPAGESCSTTTPVTRRLSRCFSTGWRRPTNSWRTDGKLARFSAAEPHAPSRRWVCHDDLTTAHSGSRRPAGKVPDRLKNVLHDGRRGVTAQKRTTVTRMPRVEYLRTVPRHHRQESSWVRLPHGRTTGWPPPSTNAPPPRWPRTERQLADELRGSAGHLPALVPGRVRVEPAVKSAVTKAGAGA